MYRTSVAFSGGMYVLSREWSTDGYRWSVKERVRTKRLHVLKSGHPKWAHAMCTMLCAKHFDDLLSSPEGFGTRFGSPIENVCINFAEQEARIVAVISDPELSKTAEVQAIIADIAVTMGITTEEAIALFSAKPATD